MDALSGTPERRLEFIQNGRTRCILNNEKFGQEIRDRNRIPGIFKKEWTMRLRLALVFATPFLH